MQPQLDPNTWQPIQRPKRPWWKAPWVPIVAAGLVGIGIGAAGAGGDEQQKGATEIRRSTVTATASATVTAAGATVTTTPIKTIATVVKTQVIRTTYTPPVKIAFNNGIHTVPDEVAPGVYKTDGGSSNGIGCYYEIRRTLSGAGIEDIIENGNLEDNAPATIEIPGDAKAIEVSGGCGWRKA